MNEETGDLIKAIKEDNTTKVNDILSDGVDINWAGEKYKKTALHIATAKTAHKDYEHSFEIVEVLINAGADVNARDYEGETPIFGAHGIAIKLLVKAGADINAKNIYGQTVFTRYKFSGRKDRLRLLLEEGAIDFPDPTDEVHTKKTESLNVYDCKKFIEDIESNSLSLRQVKAYLYLFDVTNIDMEQMKKDLVPECNLNLYTSDIYVSAYGSSFYIRDKKLN